MITFIMFALVVITLVVIVNIRSTTVKIETESEEFDRKAEELRTIYRKHLTNEDVLNEMIKTLREKYK